MIGTAKTILGALRGFPPLEWGVPKSKIEGRGKAFPLMIISLLLLRPLVADVECHWNGTNYECSGEGERVIVSGGGVVELPPVVTNIVGVCTNCSAISPSDLNLLASEIEHESNTIIEDCNAMHDSLVSMHDQNASFVDEINEYRTFRADSIGRAQATNYMATAQNKQAAAMQYVWDTNPENTIFRLHVVQGAANAVYYYAHEVLPHLQYNNSQIELWDGYVYDIQRSAENIHDSLVPQLFDGAVVCQASPGGHGGGGGSVTNIMTGNWCTYDQGEAIKKLLGHISNEVSRVRANTAAISNFTEQCAYNIRTGLFTEYNAIPRQSQLGDWKDVYLDGNETNWGYQPTNILARIELLLYGMSGVSTNENPFTEGGTESTEVLDNFDDVKDDATTQLRAIGTDADATQVQSLGQALIRFFNQFSISGQTASEGTEIWPSSVFRVGQEEYEIPTFTPTSGGASILNQAQSFSRVACIVIYFVLGAILVFRFWTWFAGKAATMSKWAVELLTSLFAS